MHITPHLTRFALVVGASLAFIGSTAAQELRIVGSSTVYPFAKYVAEELGKTTRFKTPVLESTGSGGGHKLFGTGMGTDTPSITNSSRQIKMSEFKRANENGVTNITEAVIGYDGIAIAHNVNAKKVDLTPMQLTLAVAAEVPKDGKLVPNPYKKWNEIDPSLPDLEIKIYGPPTTSGTRDAFEELVMQNSTKKHEVYGGKYSKVRSDGPWIDGGENDNLLVKKLEQDTAAFAIFGFSFLEENRDKIQGASIGGVDPTPDTISSGKYPVSRSLFFYIKNDHIGKVPGVKEYVELFMSEKMIGPNGYLKDIGLIPLPEHMRKASQQRVLGLVKLQARISSLQDFALSNGMAKIIAE